MTLRFLIPVLAVGVLVSGCESYAAGDVAYAQNDRGPPASEDHWDAHQHYRDGPNYQERRMDANERVYRGDDGRYYCRRSDGTAGLIVGGVAGGVVGDAIAPGGSRTLGTLLGVIGGAAIGSAVDRDGARCR